MMRGANGTHWIVRIALALITIVFLSVSIYMSTLILALGEPPMIVEEAYIKQPVVCSNTIIYHVRIRYRVAPLVVISTRVIWDVQSSSTRLWDSSPRYTVITEPLTFERDAVYTIVEQLPPGHFQLRIGVQTRTSKPIAVAMNFTVPEICP